MKYLRFILPLGLIIKLLSSCSSEYPVEDFLYAHLEDQFSIQSMNLESTLDSLENLYLEEGLLPSTHPQHYRGYYQANIDSGYVRQIQSDFLGEIQSKVSLTQQELETIVQEHFDDITYSSSKFGKINRRIDSLVKATGQIASSTVASSHLTILDNHDFTHPYYRANILLSLQWLYYDKYIKRFKGKNDN